MMNWKWLNTIYIWFHEGGRRSKGRRGKQNWCRTRRQFCPDLFELRQFCPDCFVIQDFKNFVFILMKKCDIHLTTHSSTNRILEWKKYIQNTLWFSDQSWSVFLIFPNLSIFPPRSQQNRMEIFPDWIWLFGKSYKSRGLLCCRQEIPNGFWEGRGERAQIWNCWNFYQLCNFYVCFFLLL